MLSLGQYCCWPVHSSVTAGTLLLAQYLLTREGEVALLLFTAQPSAAPLLSLLLHVLHAVTSLGAVEGRSVCHFLRTVPLPISSSSPASTSGRAARAIRLAAPLNVEQVRERCDFLVHFIRSGGVLGRVCFAFSSGPDREIKDVMVEVNGDDEERSGGGKNDHVRTVAHALTATHKDRPRGEH